MVTLTSARAAARVGRCRPAAAEPRCRGDGGPCQAPARRGLAAPGCGGPHRLRPAGRAAAPGRGAAPGPAPRRIGLRALSRPAGAASRARAVGGVLGRHLSLPALRRGSCSTASPTSSSSPFRCSASAIPSSCRGTGWPAALLFYVAREISADAQDRSAAGRDVAADQHPRALLQRGRQRRGDARHCGGGRLSRVRDHRHQRRQPRQYRRGARPAGRAHPEPAGRPSRRQPGQGHGAQYRRLAGAGTSCWSASTATRCSIRRRCTGSPATSAARLSGGIAGNPRIRNRTSLLGRLQVGEFSSIIGLIRRAQTTYGRLFTVSGVICAFRKRALEEAGWWSPRTITDDIDVTWRVQCAGWRVVYEPQRHRLDPDARDAARACGSSACAGPRAACR